MVNCNRMEVIKYQPSGKRESQMARSVGKLLVFCVSLFRRYERQDYSADKVQVTGIGVERFGYRPFILGILTYQCIITTTFFVAPSIQILLLAECLAGIAFGVFMSGKSIVGLNGFEILTISSRYFIRLRSMPCRPSGLSYYLGKFMLGNWPASSHRCHKKHVQT